jgi:hypothetical protein
MLDFTATELFLKNFFTTKYVFSEKEPKIRMRATRRNLWTRPKIMKKCLEHQISIGTSYGLKLSSKNLEMKRRSL